MQDSQRENPYKAPKVERTDEERPRRFLGQLWFLVLVTTISCLAAFSFVDALRLTGTAWGAAMPYIVAVFITVSMLRYRRVSRGARMEVQ